MRLASSLFLCLTVLACAPEESATADRSYLANPHALRAALDRLEADHRQQIDADAPFYLTWELKMGNSGPVGVHCEAPSTVPDNRQGVGLQGPGSIFYSDVIGEMDFDATAIQAEAGRRHNLEVIDRADFPYPDVCRPHHPGEVRPLVEVIHPLRGQEPARVVHGPARSLHDAARRGSDSEIREWATRSRSIDTPDAFRLTPLAWATLRGRPQVVQTLLSLGADPDAALPHAPSALWIAARMGRTDLFNQLVAAPTGQFRRIRLLDGAVEGGSPQIVRHVLGMADQRVGPTEMTASVRQGGSEVRAILLEAGGDNAANFLLDAAIFHGDLRAFEDALAAGGRIDGRPERCDAPLAALAKGTMNDADIMVARLLEEGADVDGGNRLGSRLQPCETPLAILLSEAYRFVPDAGAEPIRSTNQLREVARRQRRILMLLLPRRPDMTARDEDGRPLIAIAAGGRLMTAQRWRDGQNPYLETLPPDSWMRPLLAAGLDLNAEWEGQTALGWARAADDRARETAQRLEAYGAR